VHPEHRAARASGALGQREAGAEGPQRLEQAHYVEIKRQAWRVAAKTLAAGVLLTLLALGVFLVLGRPPIA
jgi:hypothetical protein